jgi:hypothetical protein
MHSLDAFQSIVFSFMSDLELHHSPVYHVLYERYPSGWRTGSHADLRDLARRRGTPQVMSKASGHLVLFLPSNNGSGQ